MVSSETDSETAGLAAEDKTAYLHPEKTGRAQKEMGGVFSQ